MEKKLILIGIVVLLMVVGLSGCEELTGNGGDASGDTSKIELMNYNVKTKWSTGSWPNKQSHEQDGFYHDFPDDATNQKYEITGTVKNIAGTKLSKITVKAHFYDSNNNFLKYQSDSLSSIPNTYTKDFTMYYYGTEEYFDNVDSVKFELIAS